MSIVNVSSLLLSYGKVCDFPNSASAKLILVRMHVFVMETNPISSPSSLGPQTKVMRKAKMSFQSGQVKQVIRTYAVEIQTSDKKELEAETVTMKLRRAMGANCKLSYLWLDVW
jgi:hypothetical protein